MYSSISQNKRNTVIIFSLFIAIISGIGLYFSYVYNDLTIFIFTLIFAIFYALFQYKISTAITLKMNGAEPISKKDAPEFYSIWLMKFHILRIMIFEFQWRQLL